MRYRCPLCREQPCSCGFPQGGGRKRGVVLTDLARADLQRERDTRARSEAVKQLFGPWQSVAVAYGLQPAAASPAEG